MTFPPHLLKDLDIVRGVIQRGEPSPLWVSAAASLLEAIAAEIREEVKKAETLKS